MNFAARQLVAIAGLLLVSASARAALRVPQVPVQGSGLQSYLNNQGESIDASTAQLDAQHWANSGSNNSTLTIQIELVGNAANNAIGLYNASSAAGGTLYSQDIRNPGHDPRVLAYAATGINSGSFWMAFEDGPVASPDHDFDDVILFLEGSIGPLATAPPVAVVRASWGSVKARFR